MLPKLWETSLPILVNQKCLNLSAEGFLPSSCSVSSAVHLLIRSLWLFSVGTGEDEVDSRIHKPGKESKFWFKLRKSYVVIRLLVQLK